MFIPDSIKIGTRDVQIIRESLKDQGLMGYFDPNRQVIAVSTDIENQALVVETFFHELVHAINHFIRFDFELEKEMMSTEDLANAVWNFQETVTERFSMALVQVLKDNSFLINVSV